MEYSLYFSIFLLVVLVHKSTEKVSEFNSNNDPWEQMYGKVQHAAIIFRHGDRNPYFQYPLDPYINYRWPQGFGELTNKGRLRLFRLGKWFRRRYANLTGRTYARELISVQSSDMDRTIMSGSCFLRGLYPATGSQQWLKTEKWQPIPVHTIPQKYDNMIIDPVKCPRLDKIKQITMESPRYQEIYDDYKETIKYIEEHTGLNFSGKTNEEIASVLSALLDTFFVQTENNLVLPNWTKEIYPEPLKTMRRLMRHEIAYGLDIKRLDAGPILESITSDMVKKVGNVNFKQTLHIYSGHDRTIVRVLKALDAYAGLESFKPPYGTALTFELRKNLTNHLVTVSYKSTTYRSPFLLYIPKCGRGCLLVQFLNITKPLIPKDW